MADLTPDQIAAVVKNAMASGDWLAAGRDFAQGMQGGTGGFSSSNVTGRAGGRGEEGGPDYRKYDRTYKTEIKLKKLANDSTSKMLKAFEEVSKTIHPTVKSFKADLHAVTTTLDHHFDQISSQFESATEEVKFWEKHTSKAGNTIFKVERKMRVLEARLEDQNITTKERKEVEEELMDIQKDRATLLKKANRSMQVFNKALIAGAAISAGGVRAGGQMMSDVEAQRRYGTPGGMTQQLLAATKGGLMGIDPELISELMATNRRALLALGVEKDMGAYYDKLGSRLDNLANIAGTRTEAMKLELETSMNLTKVGIKPTTAALEEQYKAFDFLHKAVGMTSESFAQLQTGIVENTQFRVSMHGLDKKERAERLKAFQQRVNLNIANGMLEKHAIAAATALEELGGEGPVTRMEKMAKLQAIGAIAGIKMNDEARKAMILGNAASATQKEELQKYRTMMANKIAEVQTDPKLLNMQYSFLQPLLDAGFSLTEFADDMTMDPLKLGDPDKFAKNFKTMAEQMGIAEDAFNTLTTKTEAVIGVFKNVAGGGLLETAFETAILGGSAKIGWSGIKGLSKLGPVLLGLAKWIPWIAAAYGVYEAATWLGVGKASTPVNDAIDFVSSAWGGGNSYDPNDHITKAAKNLQKETPEVEAAKQQEIQQRQTEHAELMGALDRIGGGTDKQVVQGDEAKEQREKAIGKKDHVQRAAAMDSGANVTQEN